MELITLQKNNIEAVLDLFCESFEEDSYYRHLFQDKKTRKIEMRNAFRNSISFCVEQGTSLGIFDQKQLIAFILCFDYKKTLNDNPIIFKEIFAGINYVGEKLPYADSIHATCSNISGDVMFLLSVSVNREYQKMGIASSLLDAMLHKYPGFSFVSDVSNSNSLSMYSKRNFQVTKIEENYYLVVHFHNAPNSTLDFSGCISLLVPNTKILEENCLAYSIKKEQHILSNHAVESSCGLDYFVSREGAVSKGCMVELSYDNLLAYQRVINLAQNDEITVGDFVFYRCNKPYVCVPLYNPCLSDMIKNRRSEWSIVPDIFVSIPMQYKDLNIIKNRVEDCDEESTTLLRDMEFRTQYEAGIPTQLAEVDDLAGFKGRIQRYYLGKLRIQIVSETTVDQLMQESEPIGAAAYVDIFVSVDKDSECAVLTWYSLSAPFLCSQLLDNIIRNQLLVVTDKQKENFFDYVAARFGLIKRGTPKIYAVIPKEKSILKANQIASLLAAETIYPDGENFGEIIDSEIIEAVTSEKGMGQYDRAFVCAYTNVVLQFSPEYKLSTKDRLSEGSITLFYIELIMLEEAAIHIADREIVKLFSSSTITSPVKFLKKVDKIYDDYCKTTEFWDIQVNYPTSQKSIDMLRSAFKIKDQLEFMQRNQAQLQMVFDTKCDIIDRNDSKRMDVSLALISFLAIFSAWIDGHDYIATWGDVFSESTIYIMQKILFILVLAMGIYAVTHLFGNKISVYLKMRKERRKRHLRNRQ